MSATDLRAFAEAVSWAGVAAATLVALYCTFTRAAAAARRIERGDAVALVVLLAAMACALPYLSGAPVRGAHNNEHDFLYLGRQFFPLREGGLAALLEDKEFSPYALLALIDLLTGRSLAGFLVAQKVLWVACGVSAFAALRLLGAGPAGSAVGAGLLTLNINALLQAHAFNRVLANVYLMLNALTALAVLWRARDGGRTRAAWMWVSASSYLLLTSRFEAFFALAVGALAAAVVTPSQERRAWRPAGFGAAAVVSAVVLSALWLVPLSDSGSAIWDGFQPWRNLWHHLGARNLTVVTGLGPVWGAAAGVAVLAAALIPRSTAARRGSALLAVWAAVFAVLYYTPGYYQLQMTRHHLYVLAPFALLTGWAWSLLPAATAAAGALAAAPLYLALNGDALRRHDALLRTNDREWGFLLAARREWPEDCGAAYPFRHRPDREDSREGVLAKYFPTPRPGGCVLLYRSPRTAVVDYAPPLYAPYDERVEAWYGEPWRETLFAHRFYTDWHGPWQPAKSERLAAAPVRAGFYRPSPEGGRRLARGPLPEAPAPGRGPMPVPGNRTSDDFHRSVEGCFSRGSSELVDPFDWSREVAAGQAVRCVDAALAAESDAVARAELLFMRADALDALGRRRESLLELERALADGGADWVRRPAAFRRAAALSGRARP